MAGISSVQQSVNATNVNFKGKKEERKARKFENDAAKYNKPLKTHSGGVLGALSAAIFGTATAIARFALGKIKNLNCDDAISEAIVKSSPKMRTLVTVAGIAVSAIALVGGLLIDRKINKNRAEFELKRKEIGDDKLLAEQDKHVQFTKNGNVYYKSSVGKRACAIFGAISSFVGSILGFSNHAVGAKTGTAVVLGGALSGLITGAVIDGVANKKARKFADKKAEFEAKMQAADAQSNAEVEAQPVLNAEA